MRKLITIGELAGLFKIETSQIRYYEKIGLLTSERARDSDYRLYNFPSLRILEIILQFRGLGVSIKKIKSLIDGYDVADYKQVLNTFLKDADKQILDLKKKRQSLSVSLDFMENFVPGEYKIKHYKKRKLFIEQKIKTVFNNVKEFYDSFIESNHEFTDYDVDIYFLRHSGDLVTAFSKDGSKDEVIWLPEGKYLSVYKPTEDEHDFQESIDTMLLEAKSLGYLVDGEVYAKLSFETLIINSKEYVLLEVKLLNDN